MKTYFYKLFTLFLFLLLLGCKEKPALISSFPLKNYDQRIETWIKPEDPEYNKLQLSPEKQQEYFITLKRHLIGTSSPWNKNYVDKILQATPDDLKNTEQNLINQYDNKKTSEKKIGYAENFRPHTPEWINDIAENINLMQFAHLHFDPTQRAIAIENLHARALPTEDVFFYHHRLPGEGYPFDNLQMSSLWVGTPLYILGETRDHEWYLVITPDFIAWVKSSGVARTDKKFIHSWEKAAEKSLATIIHTKTPIIDTNHQFRFTAYVGTLFPAEEKNQRIKLMIPGIDLQKKAIIRYAYVSKNDAVIMPMKMTPQHIAFIMKSLIGRPYGWGNMYFYNDCSAEMKNLFAAFGIWLPRHSTDQMYVGKMTDLSHEPQKIRLEQLMSKGRSFTTLVYIGGHVLLFIGNYPNPHTKDHALMPMTFQNMWGLSPKPPTRRAVIGKSVLFPLLETYPEDPSLASPASKKYFQYTLLDEPSNNLHKLEMIDLKNLMYP